AIVRKTDDTWARSEILFSRGMADLDAARPAGIAALAEEIERLAGPAGDQPHVARALILRARAAARGGAGTPYKFFAATLGARIHAASGRPAAARDRLRPLGAGDRSPSVHRRI